MKLKIFMVLVASTLSIFLTGCVSTVDGHKKAGVPFTKDTIESRYERNVPTMLAATKAVLGRIGALASHDIINNVVTAKVDTRTVWVKITEVDPRVTGMIVQARTKAGVADVNLASEVDKQIALYLATNQ